jgi:intraflagellar transport protein 52
MRKFGGSSQKKKQSDAAAAAATDDKPKAPLGDVESDVVFFDASKRETHHKGSKYKKLFKRLRSSTHKCQVFNTQITLEELHKGGVVFFSGPREQFSDKEIEAINQYLDLGGSAIFIVGEGGEKTSNVNAITKKYGIEFNKDCVCRTVYYKYLHPKHVHIGQGVLNKAFVSHAWALGAKKKETTVDVDDEKQEDLAFVYPNGCSLNVTAPALPILSSGQISYPVNRPIGAVAKTSNGKGRICCIGSLNMFSDEWLVKENNTRIVEIFLRWTLRKDDIVLMKKGLSDPEINDYKRLPDTEELANRLRPCLQESEPLPKDFTQLFDDELFAFDTKLVPETVKLYKDLRLKHEPLSLIPPEFECPLPPLEPAVFAPCLREPDPPALDQFDLDEHFASEKLRLAQLTNKCQDDDDLEYYIKESGDILGVTQHLAPGKQSAKHVLEYVLTQLMSFKKLNQDGGMDATMDDRMPTMIGMGK